MLFTLEDPALAEYVDSARQLMKLHQDNAAHYRQLRAKAREFAQCPSGIAGAVLTRLRYLVNNAKIATWVAVTRCETCDGIHIANSNELSETRFLCDDCGRWCDLVHVEGSEKRARTAHTGSLEAYVPPEDESDDGPLGIELIADNGHVRLAIKNGCKIEAMGSRCPACEAGVRPLVEPESAYIVRLEPSGRPYPQQCQAYRGFKARDCTIYVQPYRPRWRISDSRYGAEDDRSKGRYNLYVCELCARQYVEKHPNVEQRQ
jgi:hypothetical protein